MFHQFLLSFEVIWKKPRSEKRILSAMYKRKKNEFMKKNHEQNKTHNTARKSKKNHLCVRRTVSSTTMKFSFSFPFVLIQQTKSMLTYLMFLIHSAKIDAFSCLPFSLLQHLPYLFFRPLCSKYNRFIEYLCASFLLLYSMYRKFKYIQ